MVRQSIQTPINLFAVKRDERLRSPAVIEEAHADAEAAWYRATLAAWVWPEDSAWVWEPGQDVDKVNPKLKIFDGPFEENVPAEPDSVYPLHIETEAREYVRGIHKDAHGFHKHAHRDTLRAVRPKWNADELRRLRGNTRARFKGDTGFLCLFKRAEVAERVIIGPGRRRRNPPGCNVRVMGDCFDVKLLRRERYPQSYTVRVAGHVFKLKSKWRTPLPNPSWEGRSLTTLEKLAHCAELWIQPSFFVEPEAEDVFSIIDLLECSEELALAA
jgi:hypothetical protein